MINSFDLAQKTIFSLSSQAGVSGYEHELKSVLHEIFEPLSSELNQDFIGNFYASKHGLGSNQTIMLAAHSDEIGLIITHIDDRGFLHFTTVGGIDERTLVHQVVTVHGVKDVRGVISLLPEKDKKGSDKPQTPMLHNLIVDIGYPKSTAETLVKPGDVISIKRTPFTMMGEKIVGKALDDRAGIAVMAVCLNELALLKHQHNVLAVATVQEEVGLRGATTSSNSVLPSLALAIDVTHAQTLDTKNLVSPHLGKGPVITLGPNIHPRIFAHLTETAKDWRLAYQLQPVAGETGTDARVIQLIGCGIPTGLLSIPLRYMHTSVETASLKDIVDCGKLLACFIAALPEDLEEWLCF